MALTPLMSYGQAPLWFYNPVTFSGCVAYSPEGSLIAVGGIGGMQLYSASSGALMSCYPSQATKVNSIAFSPNGSSIAIGGTTNDSKAVAEIWNIKTGSLQYKLSPQLTAVNSLAYSRDGKNLAIGGVNFTQANGYFGGKPLELWNPLSGTLVTNLATGANDVNSVVFSTDGKNLVVGGNTVTSLSSQGVVELWSISAKSMTLSCQPDGIITSVGISPNGQAIVDAGMPLGGNIVQESGLLEFRSAATGKVLSTITGVQSTVGCVAFSPDGKTIADGSWSVFGSGALDLWDVASGGHIATLNEVSKDQPTFVAFSPNGKSLVDCSDLAGTGAGQSIFSVTQWNVSTGANLGSFSTANYTWFPAIAFGSDGSTLISTPTGGASAVQYLNPKSGKVLSSASTTSTIRTISVSQNGAVLADCGTAGVNSDGILELRNPTSGVLNSVLSTRPGWFYNCVAASPDGTELVAGLTNTNANSSSGTLELWNVGKKSLSATLDTAANIGVYTLSYANDGSLIAIGGAGESGGAKAGVVELWDPKATERVATLYPDLFQISSICFSPDGTQVAIGGQKFNSVVNAFIGGVEVWSVPSLSRLSTLSLNPGSYLLRAVTFSPDGKVLYTGTDSGIQAFDAESFEAVNTAAVGPIEAIAVSADGNQVGFTTSRPAIGVLKSPLASVTLSPSNLTGGSTAKGTVTLSQAAPAGGILVDLSSTSKDVQVPLSVSVPPGATKATFAVKTHVVGKQESVAISGEAEGFSHSSTLSVGPASLVSLTLSPATVKGGSSSIGTVTISLPAPTGSITVLVSSGSKSATAPQTVTIPPGKRSATFTVSTTSVSKQVVTGITAALGSSYKTASLTIN